MVTLFASLAALSYGFADFNGGLASRKSPAIAVVIWSQAIGLVVALLSIPLLGTGAVNMKDLSWGIAAGIGGATGVGILYKGLASGLASVVSPVAALTGATLPVFFGIFTGERPDSMTWPGANGRSAGHGRQHPLPPGNENRVSGDGGCDHGAVPGADGRPAEDLSERKADASQSGRTDSGGHRCRPDRCGELRAITESSISQC